PQLLAIRHDITQSPLPEPLHDLVVCRFVLSYLPERLAAVDNIINIQAEALLHSPRPGLRRRLIEDLTLNGDRIIVFGLFSASGERLAGNLPTFPAELH